MWADIRDLAMTPNEVSERLKLSSLQDRLWNVVPSCATTGEGLFEGLVRSITPDLGSMMSDILLRDGYPATLRRQPLRRLIVDRKFPFLVISIVWLL